MVGTIAQPCRAIRPLRGAPDRVPTLARDLSPQALNVARTPKSTYRDEVAAWVTRFPWTHIASLTFKHAIRPGLVPRKMDGWRRDLGRRVGARVGVFWATETTVTDHLHVHGLVYAPSLLVEQIKSSWKLGYAHVRTYYPGRRWRGYSCKWIDSSELDWDIHHPHESRTGRTR